MGVLDENCYRRRTLEDNRPGKGLLVTVQLGGTYSWKPPFHWIYCSHDFGERKSAP